MTEEHSRGYREGYELGHAHGLSLDYEAVFRRGYREGVIAACGTAKYNGFFNAKGRKEELYAELLTPDAMKPPVFEWLTWRLRALLRMMTAPDDPR